MAENFATLSGLAQHLESGVCAGGKATLRRVVRYVEERLARVDGFREHEVVEFLAPVD